MKQNNKFWKTKRFKNFIAIVFVTLIVVRAIVGNCQRKKKLREGPVKYTIATITKLYSGSKVPPWFEYEFEVNGKKYDNSWINHYSIADKMRELYWDSLKSYIGKRFYVKFYVPDPYVNELLIYSPVPCDIDSAPPLGWEKIPKVGKLPYCINEK